MRMCDEDIRSLCQVKNPLPWFLTIILTFLRVSSLCNDCPYDWIIMVILHYATIALSLSVRGSVAFCVLSKNERRQYFYSTWMHAVYWWTFVNSNLISTRVYFMEFGRYFFFVKPTALENCQLPLIMPNSSHLNCILISFRDISPRLVPFPVPISHPDASSWSFSPLPPTSS